MAIPLIFKYRGASNHANFFSYNENFPEISPYWGGFLRNFLKHVVRKLNLGKTIWYLVSGFFFFFLRFMFNYLVVGVFFLMS